MKKKYRSLLALAMALVMVLALTACGISSTAETDEEDTSIAYESNPSYKEENFIEVAVGDVLYSDESCSVTLTSLETNDNGGSTLTLSVVNNYSDSLAVYIGAHDKDANFEEAEHYTYYSEVGSTEAEWAYEFSAEYTYFGVVVETYSEFITQEKIDSGEAARLMNGYLCDSKIRVNAAE